MDSYKQFNLTLLPVTFIGLLSVGIFNLLIDPYGIIRSPIVQRLNNLKPAKFNNVRLFKAVDVIHLKPDILILGSSRTDIGIDPTHPGLQKTGQSYNLSIVGPNMYEVRSYFDHAIINQPNLQQVVLGIDFFMFSKNLKNTPDFNKARLERTSIYPKDFLRSMFSVNALDSSIETLESSLSSDAKYLYREDGMRYIHQNQHDGSLEDRFKGMPNRLTDLYYDDYEFSQAYLDDFQYIVDKSKEKGIELEIFISPSHVTVFEAIRLSNRWDEFEDWKRHIAEITPVWDFSGYHSVTTEPIGEEMENYWDSSHYQSKVGDLILNRIFDIQTEEIPEDFGIYLTLENVNNNLDKIREQQIAWTKEHGGETFSLNPNLQYSSFYNK